MQGTTSLNRGIWTGLISLLEAIVMVGEELLNSRTH
jgi:hypothetical protein